jgi:acetoin utilization deacetylase AcuC-like enzyme
MPDTYTHAGSRLICEPSELDYDFGPGHPMQPSRLVALLDLLESSGPRVAQRDAPSAEVASQARSILSLFSGKKAEIPLPYGNIRAMKDALMLTH